MKPARRKSYQYGTVRFRERVRQPGAWELYYRRYDNQGNAEQATEMFADEAKYPTKAEAEGSPELEELRKRINQQNGVACSVVFFSDLCEEYRRRHIPKKRPKVQTTYKGNLTYLENTFGDWRLDKLSESLLEVQEWFDGKIVSPKTGEPIANQTRKNIARLLSNVFHEGMLWKYVRHNPWSQLRVREGARPVDRDMDVETEMFHFLIDDPETPRHVRMMIIVAMCTGLRIEEILALKWTDIDFRRGRINVQRTWVDGVVGLTKTPESEAAVPLAPWLAKELQAYQQDGSIAGWLFGSDRTQMPFWTGNLNTDYLRPALVRMGEHFGLFIPAGTGFHAFRHTYITSLDTHGTTLKVQQSLARHAGSEMTLKYINKSRRHHDQMRRANFALVKTLDRTGTDGD
jgi:integrase